LRTLKAFLYTIGTPRECLRLRDPLDYHVTDTLSLPLIGGDREDKFPACSRRTDKLTYDTATCVIDNVIISLLNHIQTSQRNYLAWEIPRAAVVYYGKCVVRCGVRLQFPLYARFNVTCESSPPCPFSMSGIDW
jgi:hypothetical protein